MEKISGADIVSYKSFSKFVGEQVSIYVNKGVR